MAAPGYKILEKRSSYGGITGSPLFEAATQNRERATIPASDYDTRINLSQIGWRNLMSASRYIFANFGPFRNAILQQAKLAIGQSFIPQFTGADRKWGDKAEEMLWNWHKICDVRGQPYDFATDLFLSLVSIKRDGDVVILQTETADGYPMIQPIPSHRLGSRWAPNIIMGPGPFEGMAVINGVILNEYARPVGYRFVDAYNLNQRDEDAANVIHDYQPDFFDQARGIPPAAAAINDYQDTKEIRDFFKIALKAEASIGIIEHNEKGGVPSGFNWITLNTGDAKNATAAASYMEKFDGGAIRYFRANSGSKLEAMNSDRPARNTQDFSKEILRDAFLALEWPIGFAYNPETLGGANSRMVVAQIVRTTESNQTLAKGIALRVDAWAVAKFIKLGLLEPNDEWWKWEHQTPRSLTVDAGYDEKARLEAIKMGGLSMKDYYGANGEWWEEQIAQIKTEAEGFLTAANELAQTTGFDKSVCLAQIQQRNPNGPPAPPADNSSDNKTETP